MQLKAKPVTALSCGQCGEAFDSSGAKPLSTVNCPRCGHATKVPGVIDGFLLVEIIGRGTSGIVFRALDEKLHRQVALKILAADSQDQEQIARECVKEARALARLNHPGIVQIHTIGEFRDQHYIVMEFVGGGTAQLKYLKDKSKRGHADELDVLALGIVIAEGLGAAQRVGLTHMDIKPGNILIDEHGVGKLIDFGAAPYAKSGKDGGAVGTPYYVAPEVATSGAGDFRSDMYSLGATLFHILAGKPPFDGSSAKEVIRARLKRPAPSLREMRDVHSRTADVIARLLQKAPEDRYAAYEDLIEDLESARRAIERGEASEPAIEPIVERADDPLSMVADATVSLAIETGSVSTGASTTRMRTMGRSRSKPAKRSYALVYGAIAAVIGVAALLAFGLGGGGKNAGPANADTSTSPNTPDPAVSTPQPPKPAVLKPLDTPRVNADDPLGVGLVGRWSFDDLQRGRLGTPNATTVGGVIAVPGPHGTDRDPNPAVELDGASYLNVDRVGDFASTDAFSYGAWLKPAAYTNSCSPMSRIDTDEAHRGYDMFLSNFQVFAHIVSTWPKNAARIATKAKLTPDKWQHVMVTYDGSGRAAGMHIYIDGKQAPTSITNDNLSGPINNKVPFVIGARSNGFARNSFYAGGIDQVVIYKRELTPAEVAKLASPDALK
ncbi:MAG: protein kinase [Phycisphaera sp.]|nr:protein kinase [Phycisphaera sp.]